MSAALTAHTPALKLVGPHRDGSATVTTEDGRIVCALMPREAHFGPKIVRAINAHDDLIETMEEAIKLLGMDRPVNPSDILRAAIAKATSAHPRTE